MADTYDAEVQLGASRRRWEDAQVLHCQKRWAGAIYLGGYAIECSLKSLICYYESPRGKKIRNFKETSLFRQGMQGADLHNLSKLIEALPELQRAIKLDRTNTYKDAWNKISSIWRNDELRYSDKQGDKKDSEEFIEAVKIMHRFLLEKQGETS